MTSTRQPAMSAYPPDTCMFCHQALRIAIETDELESEEGEAATVIDDVELHCGPPGSGPGGHHAHWACLIDHAKQARTRGAIPGGAPAPPFATCAACGQNTLDASGRFVVDVRNEGGETTGFDFGEILDEERFLDAHPSQVHVRTFHDLVATGDYAGATELVAEHDIDVNATYGSERLTALQKAVFNADASGVAFLKSLGATA